MNKKLLSLLLLGVFLFSIVSVSAYIEKKDNPNVVYHKVVGVPLSVQIKNIYVEVLSPENRLGKTYGELSKEIALRVRETVANYKK